MPLCTPYPSLSKTDISIKKPSFTETNAINGYNLAPSTVLDKQKYLRK